MSTHSCVTLLSGARTPLALSSPPVMDVLHCLDTAYCVLRYEVYTGPNGSPIDLMNLVLCSVRAVYIKLISQHCQRVTLCHLLTKDSNQSYFPFYMELFFLFLLTNDSTSVIFCSVREGYTKFIEHAGDLITNKLVAKIQPQMNQTARARRFSYFLQYLKFTFTKSKESKSITRIQNTRYTEN